MSTTRPDKPPVLPSTTHNDGNVDPTNLTTNIVTNASRIPSWTLETVDEESDSGDEVSAFNRQPSMMKQPSGLRVASLSSAISRQTTQPTLLKQTSNFQPFQTSRPPSINMGNPGRLEMLVPKPSLASAVDSWSISVPIYQPPATPMRRCFAWMKQLNHAAFAASLVYWVDLF
jgi:hypothetical protein